MTQPAPSTPVNPARDPRWLGLLLILVPLLTRAATSTTILPEWDVDPLSTPISAPAIGPAASMLIDTLVLLGSALLLLAESRARRAIHPLWLIALAIGALPLLLHGWWWPAIGSIAPRGTLGHQRIGVSWLAAIAAAIAVAHACRHTPTRRLLTGVLLAFIILLALRGIQQVFIDHPATVAAFKANRESELAARGWSPDSPMAQAYERRLMQAEATGWFGLSNIYATFAAFAAAVSLAWLVASRFAPRDNTHRQQQQPSPLTSLAFPALTLLLSLAATALAASKGGVIVAILSLGFCLALIPPLAARLTPLRSIIGPICIFGVLMAVALRGMIGERFGELSILFRWFYMQASGRIIAAHPLTGVGPDGYQLAYLATKNPLSPEEVSSPHSILLDWLSTLGVGGAAWAFLLIALAIFIGRALVAPPHPAPTDPAPSTDDTRIASRIGMLAIALAAIAAMWFESPYITPDLALVRLAALAIGCIIIHAIVTLPATASHRLHIGLAAGALAMLAHAQIELTASNAVSCGLFMLALAVAASPLLPDRIRSTSPSHAPATLAAALTLALLAGFIITRGVLPARAWERDLRLAAGNLRPIADLGYRAAALSPTSSAAERRAIIDDLSVLTGKPVAPTAEGFSAAMAALERARIPAATALLQQAQARHLDEWRIGRETARLQLRLAALARSTGDRAAMDKAHAEAAIAIPSPAAGDTRAARNSPRLRAQALVHETIARQRGDQAGLHRAVELLNQAIAFDPYNTDIALRLFKLTRELGQTDAARQWATRTLELAAFTRLDRGIQPLSDADRRELESATTPN